MAQVLIRNIDEGVIDTYRRRAQAKGRPLEAELRDALAEHLRRDREDLVRELEALRASQPPRKPGSPSIVEDIREDRDSR